MHFLFGPFHAAFSASKLVNQFKQAVRRDKLSMRLVMFHISLDIFLKRIRLYLEYQKIAQVTIKSDIAASCPCQPLLMQQIDRVGFASQIRPVRSTTVCSLVNPKTSSIVLSDFLAAKCNQLIEHRFRRASHPLRRVQSHAQPQAQRDFLLSRNELQMFRSVCRNAVEIKC